ncbi:uncharacterized protein BKA78DRAFT_303670 [Phyllosticta capitalensis]|uniref:uncharacterized protein n=1 Tax=Phyllosticta capitalensis TaxID=121624 RepID=UPI00312E4FF8
MQLDRGTGSLGISLVDGIFRVHLLSPPADRLAYSGPSLLMLLYQRHSSISILADPDAYIGYTARISYARVHFHLYIYILKILYALFCLASRRGPPNFTTHNARVPHGHSSLGKPSLRGLSMDSWTGLPLSVVLVESTRGNYSRAEDGGGRQRAAHDYTKKEGVSAKTCRKSKQGSHS